MNDKFLDLAEEKRLRIINAGFEVFGSNDYNHASTEDIAAKSGISKGLLFYYFHNKKTLYLFLFEYATNYIKDHVIDRNIGDITDFFELCAYASERKCQMLRQSPFIMDFIVRAFYSRNETITQDINQRVKDQTGSIFNTYFKAIDYSKFRDDVDPMDIYQMLTWMLEGYLHEKQRTGLSFELDDVMRKHNQWSGYLKRMSYKEEYLDECNH